MTVQKISCLVLLVVLIALPSCTPVSLDYSLLPDDDSILPSSDLAEEPSSRPEFRNLLNPALYDYVIWNNMAFSKTHVTDLSTGDVFSLCSNPMCGNIHDELCAINIMKHYECFVVCPDAANNDMIIYASNREHTFVDGVLQVTDSFRKYNFSTGTQEILLDNLKLHGTDWRMDSETKTIYYMAYEVNESGVSELGLYAFNTESKENRKFGLISEQIIPMCVSDQYAYAFSQNGTAYRFALDADTLQLETLPYKGHIYDGYLYFVDCKDFVHYPVPSEILPYCEKYNAISQWDYYLADYYRLDLSKENAEPELVVENIFQCTINDKYICYTVLEPKYQVSYLRTINGKIYDLQDDNCPTNVTLVHEFSPHSGTIFVLDVHTLEQIATITSERYSIENASCVATTTGLVADFKDYSLDSIFAGQMTFKGYVPFNKPVLTEEDAVRIQLD